MRHTKHISADDQCYFRGYYSTHFSVHFNQNLQNTKPEVAAEVEFGALEGTFPKESA